jgi:hypothetical protein
VDLPSLGADLIEEPTVVRDHQQPAGVLRPTVLQVADQPGDALDVEMVRRLIQSDHVPLTDQQSGQRDAATLPAAQLADPRLPRNIGDEPADHVTDRGIPGPLVLRPVSHNRMADRRRRIEVIGL